MRPSGSRVQDFVPFLFFDFISLGHRCYPSVSDDPRSRGSLSQTVGHCVSGSSRNLEASLILTLVSAEKALFASPDMLGNWENTGSFACPETFTFWAPVSLCFMHFYVSKCRFPWES